MLVGTVYLDLIELWELDTEVGRTELFDFLNATWCLLAKLVAGEIENLQTCGLVLLVQLFEFFVLRGESTTGGGIHDEQYLALVLGERHVAACIVLYFEIINTCLC